MPQKERPGMTPQDLTATPAAALAKEQGALQAGDADEVFRTADRLWSAQRGQVTGGLSPAALALAFIDWSVHLGNAPGKQMELAVKAGRTVSRFAAHALEATLSRTAPHPVEAPPGDTRFAAAEWAKAPWNIWAEVDSRRICTPRLKP